MEWKEARTEIQNNIQVGDNLKTVRSSDRKVRVVPPRCFRVQIGQRAKVNVPWDMLEKCWRESVSAGKYDTQVFGKHFPKQKKNKGCLVHVVGKIFQRAELVDSDDDDKSYKLK